MNAHRLLSARLLIATALALPHAAQDPFHGFVPPSGWAPPPLDPTGVELETKELGPGVYALLSNRPPVDNSGFIVGERGVLVIDAHINRAMANQILAAVRAVTDKPILYLVNTNAHGDHTFGNYAFPEQTLVVAHQETAESMAHFEAEQALMRLALGERAALIEGVQLRLPDITFESTLRLDLGGRSVELHHFGHGNTPGDTVVYEPQTKVAWTGNLILGQGAIPWAIEGQLRAYLETLTHLSRRLDIDVVVPGHILTTTGASIGEALRYLAQLLDSVRAELRAGSSLEKTLASLPLEESFLPPEEGALSFARPLMQGFHRWNVKRAFEELSNSAKAPETLR